MHQIIYLLLPKNPLELHTDTMARWTKTIMIESPGVDTKVLKTHIADQHQHLQQRMQDWL